MRFREVIDKLMAEFMEKVMDIVPATSRYPIIAVCVGEIRAQPEYPAEPSTIGGTAHVNMS
jgi:hypothetical protein